MKKKKIMIYCQHLAGMGHLVRCREVIRSLVETFDVCFVSGGQIVPQFQMPPQAEIVQLPGLWQQGEELLPLDTDMTIEETRAQRKQLLLDTFNQFQPDCLITECFPFSKLSMKYELLPLLELAKASTRPVRIICSLRDLIMTQPLSLEAKEKRATKICQLVNRFYDAVLFHSDGNFQQLEDCFPQVENLNCDIVYTGYVAQSAAEPVASSAELLDIDESKPAIVVSAGGGRHGYPLLNAVIAASEPIAERYPHHIYMFAGPFMPEADFLKLQQATAKRPNLTLRRYTARLLEYLRKADLSISLGGYNTTMNLLLTGVRSLILPSLNPSQTDEQRIRAEKLARLGVVGLLTPSDLEPERMMTAIAHALKQPRNDHQINLQGAACTAAYLREFLSETAEREVELAAMG